MMKNLSVFGLSLCALVVGSLFPIVRGSLTFDSQRLLIPAIPIILIYIGVQVFYTGQNERQLRNIDSRASGTTQSLRYSAR